MSLNTEDGNREREKEAVISVLPCRDGSFFHLIAGVGCKEAGSTTQSLLSGFFSSCIHSVFATKVGLTFCANICAK